PSSGNWVPIEAKANDSTHRPFPGGGRGVCTGPDFKKIKIQQKDLLLCFFLCLLCLKQLRRWYMLFQLASMEALMSPSTRRFVAVDMPEANKLTVHILAAMAEHEREQISKRTRDALAAAKRRGKRLGNPDIAEVAKRGRAALKANARQFAANVRPIIDEIIRSGVTSHNAIAAKLNERNVHTARGGTWTHVQVAAILRPFDGANTAAAA